MENVKTIYNEVKCGDVVWAKIPKSEDENTQLQAGYRPILILGNILGTKNSPVLQYIPITSQLKRTDLPVHIIITSGLEKESMSLAEQVHSIDRHNIRKKVCTLSQETIDWIFASLFVQLGANPMRLIDKYNKLVNRKRCASY